MARGRRQVTGPGPSRGRANGGPLGACRVQRPPWDPPVHRCLGGQEGGLWGVHPRALWWVRKMRTGKGIFDHALNSVGVLGIAQETVYVLFQPIFVWLLQAFSKVFSIIALVEEHLPFVGHFLNHAFYIFPIWFIILALTYSYMTVCEVNRMVEGSFNRIYCDISSTYSLCYTFVLAVFDSCSFRINNINSILSAKMFVDSWYTDSWLETIVQMTIWSSMVIYEIPTDWINIHNYFTKPPLDEHEKQLLLEYEGCSCYKQKTITNTKSPLADAEASIMTQMIRNGYSLELIQYVKKPQTTSNHNCGCCHEPIDDSPTPFRRNQNTPTDISRGDINFKEEYSTIDDSPIEVIKKRLLEILNENMHENNTNYKLNDSDSELDEDQITIEATITFEVDPEFHQNEHRTNTDTKSTSDEGVHDNYSTNIFDNKINPTKTQTDEKPSIDVNKSTVNSPKPTQTNHEKECDTYISKNFEGQTMPKETDLQEEVKKKSLCARPECSEKALHKCSRCQAISYCSIDCSRLYWPSHRSACSSERERRREARRREKQRGRQNPSEVD